MDLTVFLRNISIWSIPALFAITLHEVAHGWMARAFGDRTADMLGRLSLNPLRHLDPIGTVLVPGLLLAVGGPVIGWAKPVPVATSALRRPRRAMAAVALAGPLANLAMAAIWCGVLAVIVRVHGNKILIDWIGLMAQAGMMINVMLAVFNALPVPPLDGARLLAAALPRAWAGRFEKLEPIGLVLVLALAVVHGLDWAFQPAFRMIGRVFTVVVGSAA